MPDHPTQCAGNRRLRVSHLSSAHRWNDVRIFVREAQSLSAAGYAVTLVAQRECDAQVDGIACLALPTPRNRVERMLVSPWRIFSKARRFDVCHFHDPELLPLGLLLKLTGARVIYDVHEDLPRQIDSKNWIPRTLRPVVSRLIDWAEPICAGFLDGVVAATPTIAARFPQEKTIVVQNFPILRELVLPSPISYSSRPLHFAYVGGVAEVRGAIEMIDAMTEPGVPAEAKLHIVGRCSPASLLPQLEARPGWKRVDYHGYQGRAKVAQVLGGVRAGLVVFHPTRNNVAGYPTKLFEYMSVGLPVISSDFPICREILGPTKAGLLVNPTRPSEIAAALSWICENPVEAEAMGERGRALIKERYNWGTESQKLRAMYETL